MLVAAIKCDLCKKSYEIPGRKAGDGPIQIPEGWATISPMIHIKGHPKMCNEKGERWCSQKRDWVAVPGMKDAAAKRKAFRERRDALRKQFDKHHACEDCIEQILTGKISLKIGSER